MLIPIAIIFETKPCRGEILVGCGKGSNCFGNIADLGLTVVIHRWHSAAGEGQCCCNDPRVSFKHVHLTLCLVSRISDLAARFKLPQAGFLTG